MTQQIKEVYKSINAVMHEMSKEGISKDRTNQQQSYKFRGIDDIFNALSPVLAENNLVILPRVKGRSCVERATKNGGAVFYSTLEVDFDVVSSLDGSCHTITTYGEAMDSADKSTNKAMSAAYKYACLQMFCIPTEGDNDADATTHQVEAIDLRESSFEAARKGLDAYRSFFEALSERDRNALIGVKVSGVSVHNMNKKAAKEVDDLMKGNTNV